MSERDAFIRAICAEPGEDTPRLAFADWLDEHDEPERAEFIRVQIKLAEPEPSLQHLATIVDRELLAKMTRLERGGVNQHELRARSYPIASKRLDECRACVERLQSRERALFANRCREWFPNPTGAEFKWLLPRDKWNRSACCTFARGFVSVIELPTADFIKHASAILEANPVESILLTHVRIEIYPPSMKRGWRARYYRHGEDESFRSNSWATREEMVECLAAIPSENAA